MIVRIALFALCIVTGGCQVARMPLPDDLLSSERWTVEGRQGLKLRERLRFGPYEAQNVDRSWTRGRDRVSEPFERNERNQRYSFVLKQNGESKWLVKCSTALDKGSVRTPIVDVDVKNRSTLDCAVTDANGSDTWLLALKETRERPLEGRLFTDTEAYEVRGTTALKNSLATPATSGYYFMADSRTVAAVEVVNKGSVTLHSVVAPDRKSLFSAAAAALLLLEDLRESIEA